MEQYIVTGMTCAACQARVEKAVCAVPGVSSASVSLLTNSMGVEGTASPEQIIKAVEDAGYGAKVKGENKTSGSLAAKLAAEKEALEDHETPKLRRRLIASLGFLFVLMYFSMGHMMWGWPLPAFFNDNHVAMGLAQLILCVIVMVINQKFFISGFKSLWHRSPNMDSLIALGSMAGFVYSTVILFLMTRAVVDGDHEAVKGYMMEFYFESSAMILALITVGKMLESYSKGKTTNALKGLMDLAPKTANVLRDDEEITVPVDEVQIGDIFTVRPGENIPVDGVVLEGNGAVNESALTGESIPVDKEPGDEVSSATLNQSGFLKCRATRVGEDTTLSQIIQMVSDAAATKAPVAKLADKISGIFVPAVIGVSLVTFAIWMLLGAKIGYALARAITVLVVSCPCALGLATPVAIMVGNGMGAKNGILFKNAESLQETGNIQIVALDKTGTITSGQPVVTGIYPADGTEEELLERAYALELKSEHPLAKAIVEYGKKKEIHVEEAKEFTALPGSGLQASWKGSKLYGGNYRFIITRALVSAEMMKKAEDLAASGQTPLYFAEDNHLLGIIAVADAIKDDSAQAVKELRDMGIHVVMLTGDNRQTAEAIGKQAGVNEVIAGVMPDGKEAVIRELQKHGKTAMVGDGINDAPALTRADIGIAIGAGTDVAIDAADVVLMKSRLTDVSGAVRLSRKTYKNILENLFWALFYNTLLIPAAAGLYTHFGITMNPMLGAAAMSLSSFCVVTNALRLNLFKVHDASNDKPGRHPVQVNENGCLLEVKEEVTEGPAPADTIVKIEGMMCEHCEATVKKTLEQLDGVKVCRISHEEGIAEISNGGNVSEEQIKKAVEDKDYTFVSMTKLKGDNTMTKTLKIEGMMCPHCEATVKKALEQVEGVENAAVSHTDGCAVVTLKALVEDEALKNAVEAKDYKVTGIE